MAQHVLHGAFQRFRFDQPLVDGRLQVLIIGAMGEVYIVAAIDGRRGFQHLRRSRWFVTLQR